MKNSKKACIKLDASIFEPFMEDDTIFEEKEKYSFLAGLKTIFEIGRSKGGVHFIVKMSEVKCLGCIAGHPVSRFDVYEGNLLVHDFGYLISKKNGVLVDIYQCNLYWQKEGRWLKPDGMPAIFVEYPQVKNQ